VITAEDVAAMVGEYGEACVLRRGIPPAHVDVAVHGKQLQLKPEDLVGDIVQTDRKVVIGHTEIAAANWPGSAPIGPKRGDRLQLADGTWVTVQLPGTRRVGDAIVGHWMIVRG